MIDETWLIQSSRTVRKRFEQKVDRGQSECWIWVGALTHDGYARLGVGAMGKRRVLRAHRVAYILFIGELGASEELDHSCGVRRCVNPAHLRKATRKQNVEHLTHLPSRNTSGYRGVSLDRRTGRWVAYVGHHGKKIYLGTHPTAEDAAEVARKKREELFTWQ